MSPLATCQAHKALGLCEGAGNPQVVAWANRRNAARFALSGGIAKCFVKLGIAHPRGGGAWHGAELSGVLPSTWESRPHWRGDCERMPVMNTRASDHYTSHGADVEDQQKTRDSRGSRDIPQPSDPEQHWDELHRTNGFGHDLVDRARRHVRNASIIDIAGAAVAGLALGYLLFSPRRSRGLRDLLLGSLVPAASKGVHDAWDGVRKGGAISGRALSDFGDRVSHMSDQVGDRFSDLASRASHGASKLRSRW